MDYQLHPGPLSPCVLTQQADHRSTDVWDNIEYTTLPLKARQHLRNYFQPHDRVVDYIRRAGFYCIYRVGCSFRMDMNLITALVERWRPETHTFHLPVGEVTITLQDVAVLFGLRVDGIAVTGTAAIEWPLEVHRLLGTSPSEDRLLKGSSLKIRWLRDTFHELPDNADEETVQQYARAYILIMMGSILFPDASGGDVQLLHLPLLEDLDYTSRYSWGAATLAYLYRQLCRAATRNKFEIGGPLILLQLWAWERILIGRPRCIYYPEGGEIDRAKIQSRTRRLARTTRGSWPPPLADQFQHGLDSLAMRWLRCTYDYNETPQNLMYYRDALDRQRDDQFCWEPYTTQILTSLTDICCSDAAVWTTQAPLICFDIVEWHRPERVLRQFGYVPQVPVDCDNNKKLHKQDRRGKLDRNWAQHHKHFIEVWDNRAKLRVFPTLIANFTHAHQEYMQWYKTITRRLISPPTSTMPGQYQPVASNMYMMGQHISPQGHDLFRRMSVDSSFFWSQEDGSESSHIGGRSVLGHLR